MLNDSIYFAPPGWEEESPNPFTCDGFYGHGWSCFKIRDVDDENIINGRRGKVLYRVSPADAPDDRPADCGPYFFRAGRRVPGIERRLADFLRYKDAHGRRIIIDCPPDIDAEALVSRAMQEPITGSTPRSGDPEILVHSTTTSNWEGIRGCGKLISQARLRESGVDIPGIGVFAFGEPSDYAEYVMFGGMERIGPEHVVSSQEKGYLITEEEVEYEPGARLYFDGHRIVRDGLVVRDGLHEVKVHGNLTLEPYLIAAVTRSDVDPNGEVSAWTPRTFLDKANSFFSANFSL